MSDYLGNLAQRAISSEAAIQPRPISLFSSSSNGGDLGALPAWDWSALFDEEAWQEIDTEISAETKPSSKEASLALPAMPETAPFQKAEPVESENHERVASAALAAMIVTKIEKHVMPSPILANASLRENEPAHPERASNAAPWAVTKEEKNASPQVFLNSAFREAAVAAHESPMPLLENEAAHPERASNAAPWAVTKEERNASPQVFLNSAFREAAVAAHESPLPPNLIIVKEEIKSEPRPSFHTPENRVSASPAAPKSIPREAQTKSAAPQYSPKTATVAKPPSHALPLPSSRSRSLPETSAPLQKNVLEMIAPRNEASASLHETGVAQPLRAEQEAQKRDFVANSFIRPGAEAQSELRNIIATAPQPAVRPQIIASTILRPYVEAAKSAWGDSSQAQAPPATPTIRVNIGRIEVRAVTPQTPAPRPKRAATSPRLSLEDYLKQRSGGQR